MVCGILRPIIVPAGDDMFRCTCIAPSAVIKETIIFRDNTSETTSILPSEIVAPATLPGSQDLPQRPPFWQYEI